MQHRTPIVTPAYWLHRNPLIGGNGCLWETNHSQGRTEACLSVRTHPPTHMLKVCLFSDATACAAALWISWYFSVCFEKKKKACGFSSLPCVCNWMIKLVLVCNGLHVYCDAAVLSDGDVSTHKAGELGDAAHKERSELKWTSFSPDVGGGRTTGAIPQWDGVQREGTCVLLCVCACVCECLQ